MRLFKITYIILFLTLFSCREDTTDKKIKNYLLDLNRKSYNKMIKNNDELIIVGYFRDSDKVNNHYKSILNKTAETFKDSITFAHIDVDKNYKFAKENKIKCVPTYKFIKNGEILQSLNGTLDSLQLDLAISEITSVQVKVEPENLYAND
ncbi:MAG: hypothetical protein JXR69_07405 [Candidatus Delongbacteria bacterium]|nr:hypothetical protein [Candidatus Delongbacteria bacterium]